MPNNRLQDWDALRGIMMLLGVVLHAGLSFVEYPTQDFWPYKFAATHLFFDMIVTIIHLYRVPVFFIIAGYFMTMQLYKHGQKKAIVKRIKRILVPFVVSMLLVTPWVVYGFVVLMKGLENITFWGVEKYWSVSLGYTVHFWFLYYLLIFYVMHLLYWNLCKFDEKVTVIKQFPLVLLVVQLMVLLFWGNDSIHGSYSFIPPLGSVFYYLGYYVLGVWVFDNLTQFQDRTRLSRGRIISYLIVVFSYLIVRWYEDFVRQEVFGVALESALTIGAAVSLVFFNFGLFRVLFSQEKKWVKQMANASYLVYIIHMPIVLWLVYLLKDWFVNPFAFFMTLVLFTSIISFALYFAKVFIWKKLDR